MYGLDKYSAAEQEAIFQKAYAEKDWDQIWKSVHQCCLNIAKVRRELRNPKAEDRIMDAVVTIVDRMQRLKYPKIAKLSNYCFLPLFEKLHSAKAQFEDNQVQWDFAMNSLESGELHE